MAIMWGDFVGMAIYIFMQGIYGRFKCRLLCGLKFALIVSAIPLPPFISVKSPLEATVASIGSVIN